MDFKKFVDKIKDLGLQKGFLPPPDSGFGNDDSEIGGSLAPPPEAPPEHESIPLHPSQRRGDNGVFRNPDDVRGFAEKTEHVERVRELFGGFGPQVSTYVLSQSLSQGGVGRMIMKLGLVPRGRDAADLAQIENWLLKNGVEDFCKIVGLRLPGAPAEEVDMSGSANEIVPPEGMKVKSLDAVDDISHGIRGARRPSTRAVSQHEARPRGDALAPAPATHLQKVTVTPVNLSEGGGVAPNPLMQPRPLGGDEGSEEPPRPSGFPFAPKK